MKKLVKRLVHVLARGEVHKSVKPLNDRVSRLENLLAQQERAILALTPDPLPLSAEASGWVACFLQERGMTGVPTHVSKSDLMFRYLLQMAYDGDADAAFRGYFESGYDMFCVARAVVERRFGSLANVDGFLDFASGHGRMGRYLSAAMDPTRVWASDIKESAVRFQRERFGVNGVVSTERPDDFCTNRQFDLIFVASLFSHLPDEAFKGWLRRLGGLLSPRGVMLFSVHDAALNDNVDGLIFKRQSEELLVRGEDRQLSVDQYGTTYVSERYVAQAVAGCGLPTAYVRYPKALWGFQDAYLVSPAGVADLKDLAFR